MLFTSFLWQMTIHLSTQKEPTVFDPHWRPVTSGLSRDAFTHNDGFQMNLKQNPARHPWRSVLTTSKLSSHLKLCCWFTESLSQSKPQALHAVGSLKSRNTVSIAFILVFLEIPAGKWPTCSIKESWEIPLTSGSAASFVLYVHISWHIQLR